MIDILESRSWFWWSNQIGIMLEVGGAALIVISAFMARSKIKNVPDSYDAELAVRLRDIIANQAFRELFGFGLLALGLLVQMIGGLERL